MIVPVFTLIIVALISVSGYMHDKVVMRNILNQLSIEYSRNITSNEQKALLVKSEEYIKDKTIFVKKVSVKPGSYAGKENAAGGINHITCTAEWPFKLDFFGINIGNISMSREVYRNHSEQIIRKANIMLHK